MIWSVGVPLLLLVACGVVWGSVARVVGQHIASEEWMERYGAECSLQMVNYLYDGGSPPTLPESDTRALVELVHSICSLTAGYDTRRVNTLVQTLGIQPWLERMSSRPEGWGYAYAAAEMGVTLDVDRSDEPLARAIYSVRYADDRAFVHYLAARPMSIGAVAVALELRRRRFGAEDYRFALASDNPREVSIALAAVRRVCDDRAVDDVRRVVDTCDEMLLAEALYTLVVLHAPLSRLSVERAVQRLDGVERKRLFRLMIVEGYSVSVLLRLAMQERNATLDEFVMGFGDSFHCRLDTPNSAPQSL